MYDYELPVTEEALNASIARINSQTWGPNLYGVVRSHVRHVSVQTTEILYLKYALLTWKTGFFALPWKCKFSWSSLMCLGRGWSEALYEVMALNILCMFSFN